MSLQSTVRVPLITFGIDPRHYGRDDSVPSVDFRGLAQQNVLGLRFCDLQLRFQVAGLSYFSQNITRFHPLSYLQSHFLQDSIGSRTDGEIRNLLFLKMQAARSFSTATSCESNCAFSDSPMMSSRFFSNCKPCSNCSHLATDSFTSRSLLSSIFNSCSSRSLVSLACFRSLSVD